MTKVHKALAKLFFALGEENAGILAKAGNPAFIVEYLAFSALRESGLSLQTRYFAMGSASANRKAAKPPRGKSSYRCKPESSLPRRGSAQAKPARNVCREQWSKEDFV